MASSNQVRAKMKYSFTIIMVIVALLAALGNAQANAIVHSKAIVIEFPSDLPEQAQGPAETMYLYHTGGGQAILYLEKDQGRTLGVFDVTDPGHIQVAGKVSIAAPSTYDFVQDLGNSVALIQYRDQSGFAVISFKNYKQPVLTAQPDYLHSATVESYGPDGLVLVSTNGAATRTRGPQYQFLTMSGSLAPIPVGTVQNVIQRVDLPETGTIFLLNDQGVTVVRRPAVEREHQAEELNKAPLQ